jgi:hypothetical protein
MGNPQERRSFVPRRACRRSGGTLASYSFIPPYAQLWHPAGLDERRSRHVGVFLGLAPVRCEKFIALPGRKVPSRDFDPEGSFFHLNSLSARGPVTPPLPKGRGRRGDRPGDPGDEWGSGGRGPCSRALRRLRHHRPITKSVELGLASSAGRSDPPVHLGLPTKEWTAVARIRACRAAGATRI